MDFSIKACDWTKPATVTSAAKADCIVVGAFEGQPLAGAAQQLDSAGNGMLSRLVKAGDIDGKLGSTVLLHEVAGAARVLVVGLGKRESLGQKAFIDAARAAWRALASSHPSHVVWTLADTTVNERDVAWTIRASIISAREQAYKFDRFKTKGKGKSEAPAAKTRGKAAAKSAAKSSVKVAPAAERGIETVTLTVPAAAEKLAKAGLLQGVSLANGIELTRDLGNLPGNVCTPEYLADSARQLAREFKLKAEILGPKQIEALGMRTFLSVAKGSVEPPQFIVVHYQGAAAKEAPVVLVGKGITFDSGGISLKPGEAMDEMKYDMCGAASVLGTLRAVAEMGLKINLIGVIPTCENMPAANALKPGDIITSMSGRTVEVLNTDAEGRLILCDALTYVERFKPALVIDIATLTGACIIALGHHNTGLYARPKDDALADALLAAAKTAPDPTWRMPLDDEYLDLLKSPFADIANIGGRPAGSVTAACFLSHFTEAYPWAHLDIAGTAWKSGAAKNATGRPVPLLTQFLIDRVGAARG